MSDGVWFLFTARPSERSEFVVEACVSNGGPRPFIVRDDPPLQGIGPLMDRMLELFPAADFYGWLADDTFPDTPGWSGVLEEAAGSDRIAYAADGGYVSVEELQDGSAMSSGLCWGGELVRAVGSWSLGFQDAWLDVAWLDLVRPLGLYRYCPEVLVRHDHWRTGRREPDDLDRRSAVRVDFDRQRFHDWQEHERRFLIQRLEAVCVS